MADRFEFVIVGAGVAGATAFYYLSQIAPTLLIEKKIETERFYSARILVQHAASYLISDIPRDDSTIFLRPVNTIGHSSRNKSVDLKGNQEFGAPFGTVIDEQNFIRWHIKAGQGKGGQVLWNTTVTQIQITLEKVDVRIQSGENIEAKVILLATGSYDPHLQRSLGFGNPYYLNELIATFFASSDVIDASSQADYFFHMHPQMSTCGPVQMTRGRDFFNFIYVSSDSFEQMSTKFLRILQNYQPIQYMFHGVKNPPSTLTAQDFRYIRIGKHPISTFVQDRVMLLGESTGIVTECYYEGLLGAFASSKFAAELLRTLNNARNTYSRTELLPYETSLRAHLLKNFHTSQKGSEELFYTSRDEQLAIWDAYIDAIKNDRKVRHNIYLAWTLPDLAGYPLENDQYCGEKIYFALPLGTRIKLTPYFLRLKFTS